jgi:hypothetical protein
MAADKKSDKKPEKEASADDIMPLGGIKALLKQVKKDGGKEVSCAVCLPEGDKNEAVILLDRVMGPKGVRKHLIKEAKEVGFELDERSIRFGKASMDPNDETILLIKVNKLPSGEALTKAIRKRVKSLFKAVEFSIDAGLENEAEVDGSSAAPAGAGADGGAPPPAPPPPGGAAPGASAEPAAPPAPPPPPPAPPPPPPPAPPPPPGAQAGAAGAAAPGAPPPREGGAAQLKALTDLVREAMAIIAQNPAARSQLLDAANVAQASLKEGDAGRTEAAIKALRDAINGAKTGAQAGANGGAAAATGQQPPPPPPAPPGPAQAGAANGGAANGAADAALAQRLTKTRTVWDATIGKMERDLDQIAKTVTTAANGHELADDFEKEFQTVVKPVLTNVDKTLSDLLDSAAKATDAQQRQKIMADARKTVGQLQAFIASSPVISHIDKNPFHKVAVGNTLNASLAAVSKSLG